MPQVRRALASVAHFRPNRENLPLLLVVAMAMLGTAHVLVRTWTYGAAVGFDATQYLATAENLVAGAGLTGFDGGQYTHWPPLFPLLLAFFEFIGVGAEEGGRWMNAVIFGLIILVSGMWLLRVLRSRVLALAATATILVAYPLTDRSSYLMTEPLFILLTLLGLTQTGSFLKSQKKSSLVLAAICFGLGAVTRYAGVVGVLSGLLITLFWPRMNGRRIQSGLIMGIIASIPLLSVLIYNQLSAGTLTGDRSFASRQSFLDSIQQTISVFDQWVTLDGYSSYLQILYIPLAILLCTIASTIFLKFYFSRTVYADYLMPMALFLFLYLGAIIITVPYNAGSPIDDRYVIPIYVPLILICTACFGEFCSRINISFYKRMILVCIMIGSAVHVGFSVEQNLSDTSDALEHGYRDGLWNTAHWDDSEVISWLQDNPVSGKLYSNAFDLLWYHRGELENNTVYRWLNNSFDYMVGVIYEDLAPSHVVLVAGGPFSSIPYADTIRFVPGMEVVAEFSDGGIYRFPTGWYFDEDAYHINVTRYLIELTESDDPVADDVFEVYVNSNTLVYVKDPCVPEDIEAWFFLHVYPHNLSILPEERQRWGFDGFDFLFNWHAMWIGEKCLTTVDLPDYGIATIRTGQYTGQHTEQYDDTSQIWSVEFALPDREPVASSAFDVYVNSRTLLYVKEPCVPTDTEAHFFVHVYPHDSTDLPGERRQGGFDGFNFIFDQQATWFGEKCLTTIDLPDYDIATIHTGQYDDTGQLWSVEFALPGPVASDKFDVYVNGRTLIYVREPCVPADTEAWFFVHVDAVDPDDLPGERRQWGFDGLDFIFDRQATWFGEKCLTTLDLPDYDIAAIRTGQYDDTGQLWRVEFALPDEADPSSPP